MPAAASPKSKPNPTRAAALRWIRDGDQWVLAGSLGEYRMPRATYSFVPITVNPSLRRPSRALGSIPCGIGMVGSRNRLGAFGPPIDALV